MTDDPTTRLQQTIVQQVVDIGAIVDAVVNRIRGVIGEGIAAVFEPVAAALQGALDLIAQLVGGLLGDLVTPEDMIRGTVEEWLKLWTGDEALANRLTGWIGHELPLRLDATMEGSEKLAESPAWRWLFGAERSSDDVGELFNAYKRQNVIARTLTDIAANVASAITYLQSLKAADLAALQQDVLTAQPVMPLTLAELAAATVQSQVGEEWARQQALRLGIAPELFDVTVRTFGDPPGPETMLELWRRGVTDEAGVEQAMRESRLKNKYIEPLKQLRFVLPSPSDLVRFLVRDALDPRVVQSLQLDAEFDQKFDPALFFQVGLSEQLARYYWYSHWQLPSPTQLFEMHHRTADAPSWNSEPVTLPSGATVHRHLSAAQVRETLKINDLLPPFLDKYLAISFNPPTRIDARRMYLADQFTDDDLYRAFLDEGYTAEFAGQMLAWMQAAKAKAKHDESIRIAGPVIGHVRDMYRNGTLDGGTAEQQLGDLGIEPDTIALWLRADDLDRERRRANAIRDDLHRLYVGEFLSEYDIDSRLSAEGFTPAERGRLLDDWRLDLQLKEESDDQKRMRELTKAHVLDAFKDRRVNRDEAAELLAGMGYPPTHVEFWLADVEWDTAQKDADTVREAVHADYVDQIIERGEASRQLDSLNVPSAHREALLRRWDSERRRREPRLNIGQVTQLAENQVIPPDELVGYLRKLRYQDAEIELLQRLWGYEVGVTRERLDLAREQFAFRQAEAERARQEREERQAGARQEREVVRQARESQRLATEQRAQERQIAAEQRRAKAQADAVTRQTEAEAARHERNVQEALAREERARQDRDAARQLRVDLQQQSLSAADERQARTFAQQDKTLAQRETLAEARYQRALQDRVTTEQRREEATIRAEDRREQARIRLESRSTEARIATESRGERRQLERELRTQQAQQAREERAQAARVAQEQRVAEQRAVVAQAQAQAQLQIQQLRQSEAQRLAGAAAERQRRLEEATQRRIGALQ